MLPLELPLDRVEHRARQLLRHALSNCPAFHDDGLVSGLDRDQTQTLLDLYTIYGRFGRLNNLTCLLAGDPLNSRVIHSLIRGLSLFENNTVYMLSPEQLRLRRADLYYWSERGIRIVEINSEKEIPG